MALAFPSTVRALLRRWRVLSLARQYLLAGAAVLVVGMVVIGFWVTRQIEEGVTQNTATATALYVDGVIAPLLADIDGSSVLSEGARRALDETLAQGALGARLETFKLWGRGGLITYSSDPSLIGKRFQPTDSLKKAWSGHVAAEFDDLDDDEDATERGSDVPLLEIYNPIRAPWSGEIVAVAEFYEHAGDLENGLFAARLRSWFVVAAVTLAMMGALFGIVMRGSATIARQRSDLEGRVADLQRLLAENRRLGRRVREASSRVAALNERTLRRLSADLHDGPAQLLALASLRLGSPGLAQSGDPAKVEEIRSIRGFLDEAMSDIRGICHGLALPTIESLDLAGLVETAALAHERRTGTHVRLDLPAQPVALSPAEKIGVYRFVQEGLTNAFRHAGGAGQAVTVRLDAERLTVRVDDRGGGIGAAEPGLGLSGLRDRIESLGGTLDVETGPEGTGLVMTIANVRELAA
ncbi:sensor histidine kinase [Aureimonas leprariae]|uniref:histidine kinase n=1 Tax=Plantimonas leprariae TaxID=2615207 RepID=A0A7V7PPU3_9HYPH|nr:sensor histidine kinase [Aureimonas leprariae]KAB0680045.1 sensor histidine kinase [Aureimonas leprariae]